MQGFGTNLFINIAYIIIHSNSRAMLKPLNFDQLIRDHYITAQNFFQTPGITTQVKNNLSKFTQYVRTHRIFALKMIKIALNVTYQQLEDLPIKTASYNINEILGNQEPELFQLFFQSAATQPSEPTDIPQQLEGGIQSEAERLFNMDEEQTGPPEQVRPIQITGRELLIETFQVLKENQPNETCLGHLQKLISYLIRHNALRVLAFFQSQVQSRNLVLNKLQYASISSIMAQLLTSEDKKKQYAYEPLKKLIFETCVDQMFKNFDNLQFFEGIMTFIQQIFNSTKQTYYEFFQDFKRISNYLVSEQVLHRFYEQLFKLNQNSFLNASRFLQLLFYRINNDQQENSYYQTTKSDPTMKFEISEFVQNRCKLIDLLHQIGSFNPITKINYSTFIYNLIKVDIVQNPLLKLLEPTFIKLLQLYSRQINPGIYKKNLFNIIKYVAQKVTKEEVQQFIQQKPQALGQYFVYLKNANYASNKAYHKNQNSAFDVGILVQLSKKDQKIIAKISQAIGKDFKRITKKLDTKIANFLTNPLFTQEQQSQFIQNIALNKINNQAGQNNLNLNFVGKNNTPVPFLQLPQKLTQKTETKEEETIEFAIKVKDLSQSTQIIEEEEVVIITDLSIDKQFKAGQLIKVLKQHMKEKQEIKQKAQYQPLFQKNDVSNKSPLKPQSLKETILFYNRHLALF